MSSMEHPVAKPAFARSIPPELALLVLLGAFILGMAMSWPWNWH